MKEPKSFDDAWNCADPDQRTKLRAAIKKEFSDMESRNVWDVISKEEVPKIEDASNVSGEIKGTGLLEQDWLLVDTDKSLVLISMKVLPWL
jgi:hypothetical protein